jgi:DNA polymerase III subunit delta'
MDFQKAISLPWLRGPLDQIQLTTASGRLPHALLILSNAGLGAELLANRIAAASICASGGEKPCGVCPECVMLRADTHPDVHFVEREEEAQQIKVEQVRGLIESLQLTSYRGRYKVGILAGAETLNSAGANAFLKTLEEPAANTLLILVATPNHRLPATIASRCRRITLQTPDPQDARLWLAQQGVLAGSCDILLNFSNGAPLKAVALETSKAQEIAEDMKRSLSRMESQRTDVSLVAERWFKGDLPLRMIWLENWITERIRSGCDAVGLPGSLLKAKIRALFDLLDDTRELRRSAATSTNLQLALESLLIKHFVRER